jgi:hypothetical protein
VPKPNHQIGSPQPNLSKPPQLGSKSADPYQDIIELQPPHLPNHPPMSRTARAAQFMPFKALEPHEANIHAVEEFVEQKTDTYIEFDEIYPDF